MVMFPPTEEAGTHRRMTGPKKVNVNGYLTVTLEMVVFPLLLVETEVVDGEFNGFSTTM